MLHRLPDRIGAYISICFVALIVYRKMRQRLKFAVSQLSPEAALAALRRIQRHRVSIRGGAGSGGCTPFESISTIHQRQSDVLAALKIKTKQVGELSLL